MTSTRTIGLIIALLVIGGLIYYFESERVMPEQNAGTRKEVALPSNSDKPEKYSPAQEIRNPSGFINTEPFALADLIGKKVILVDFWTYSCINCQRTLPYLTAWYEKYKNQGLEIVGIHTPEFEFEKERDNVVRATEQFAVTYPVVQDNDYGTWFAYENRYWPRKYLIDIDGYIVYDHIGEGGYEETEKKIQELLKERMERLGEEGTVAGDVVAPEGAESVKHGGRQSPETYFGSLRNTNFGSGTPGESGIKIFIVPGTIEANTLYLDGTFEITGEYAENKSANARIVFKYGAEKVFIVLSSENGSTIEIIRDGKPVIEAAGEHNKGGEVFVQEEKLYRIVEDPAGFGEHTLEIIIKEPGVRAFAFTFG
jgi:thiol-disulfide isomerase/thioredoxin